MKISTLFLQQKILSLRQEEKLLVHDCEIVQLTFLMILSSSSGFLAMMKVVPAGIEI